MRSEIDNPATPGETEERNEFSIGDLADKSGLSVRNLRAYLQLGVLHRAIKQGRSLVFDDSHVQRLVTVAELRNKGYSLAAIKDVLEESDSDVEQHALLADFIDRYASGRGTSARSYSDLAEPLRALTDAITEAGHDPSPELLHAICSAVLDAGKDGAEDR